MRPQEYRYLTYAREALPVSTIGKPPVLRFFCVLAVVNLALVVGLYWLDSILAWSVLAGALLFILPHSYFTFYAFRFSGARSSRLVAQSFNRGEAGKYVLTMVGFACVFSSPLSISLLYVLPTYAVNWLIGTYLSAKVIADMKY